MIAFCIVFGSILLALLLTFVAGAMDLAARADRISDEIYENLRKNKN